MNPVLSRKRSINSNTSPDDTDTAPFKKHRSRSLPPLSTSPIPFPRPPPSGYDLDRLNYHIHLQDFRAELQNAANAIFPGNQQSRYERVNVILLSWEEEDPNLPVSIEIKELREIFKGLYGYEVEEYLIPTEYNCHNRLQSRILEFLGENDPRHLKIVYYAGHGKLTNHGQPAWTSRRNSRKDRCPTIKWSGIQNTLEESRSDVLILLDCCSSGVCTTDEGNGVTELIAACAYNAIANGVGPFSFTHALNTKLRQMAQLPSFTIGYLYNAIFTEIQDWRLEDSRHKKVPVHLVLSQNHQWPRSIRLSNFTKRKARSTSNGPVSPLPTAGTSHSQQLEIPSAPETSIPGSLPPDSVSPFSQEPSPSFSGTSPSNLPEYPRLLFSIRLSEDIKPNGLSSELFTDWLRSVPVSASLIRVEAGFASDSTLLILSMPPAMLGYLPWNPAITLLGTVRSEIIMVQTQKNPMKAVEEAKMSDGMENPRDIASKDLGNDVRTEKSLVGSQAAISNSMGASNEVGDGMPPLYINRKLNPKQYHRILKRREVRKRFEEALRLQSKGSPLSPSYSSPSTPEAHTDEEEATSVYSLPVYPQNQVILAKMKPAHLSLSGSIFGGDIPEDIGYEIYKLGTLIQALNPKRPEIDEGW